MAASGLSAAARGLYGRKWTLYHRKKIVLQEVDSLDRKRTHPEAEA